MIDQQKTRLLASDPKSMEKKLSRKQLELLHEIDTFIGYMPHVGHMNLTPAQFRLLESSHEGRRRYDGAILYKNIVIEKLDG